MEKFMVDPKKTTLLPPQKTRTGAEQILIRPATPLSAETVEKLKKIKNWI